MDPTLLWSFISCHLCHLPRPDFKHAGIVPVHVNILILHGMEYRDWIGPRKFYFLLPILCPYLPSLVSTSDTVMPWNIVKLGNKFNYNDDPSPTPKNFELDGLLLINVAIPFGHNQLIATILLEYPFPVVTPFYIWSHAYLQLLHLLPRNPFCCTICI